MTLRRWIIVFIFFNIVPSVHFDCEAFPSQDPFGPPIPYPSPPPGGAEAMRFSSVDGSSMSIMVNAKPSAPLLIPFPVWTVNRIDTLPFGICTLGLKTAP